MNLLPISNGVGNGIATVCSVLSSLDRAPTSPLISEGKRDDMNDNKTYTNSQNAHIRQIIDSDAPPYIKEAYEAWGVFAEKVTMMLIACSAGDSEIKFNPNEFSDLVATDIKLRFVDAAAGTLKILKED